MKSTFLMVSLVVGYLTLPAASAVHAQANFFVPPGGVGSWSTASNWTLAHVPTGAEVAIIHAGREATLDFAAPGVGNVRIADNDAAAVDGTLNILSGASLNVAGQVLLGAGGPSDIRGVINQTGGSLTVADALFLAFDPPHSAQYNLSGGTVTTGNLWFRFGNGTVTQTGGTMNAQQLVLAEGGNPLTSSVYDLQDGIFNVANTANIGKAPGLGDPFAGSSHGSMTISGGIATFGNLLFGTDPTDQIHMSGSGILRVRQSNYSEAAALAAIASGQITGLNLTVNTYDSGNGLFTQVSVIPEPTTSILMVLAICGMTILGQRSRKSPR